MLDIAIAVRRGMLSATHLQNLAANYLQIAHALEAVRKISQVVRKYAQKPTERD